MLVVRLHDSPNFPHFRHGLLVKDKHKLEKPGLILNTFWQEQDVSKPIRTLLMYFVSAEQARWHNVMFNPII